MNKKILIVEDEASLRKMFVEKMRHEGLEVIEAKDGKEGLALALKEHPDLISLDLNMPVMDGLTMLKNLREDTWGKEAAVIIWSVFRDENKVKEAEALGVDIFLIKSDWKLKDVVGKIKEKIGK
jgi:DNA-binding response OmpR family regulator